MAKVPKNVGLCRDLTDRNSDIVRNRVAKVSTAHPEGPAHSCARRKL